MCVQIVAFKHTHTQMYACNKTAAAGLVCAYISVFDFASPDCCQRTGWRSDRWHWSWWRKQSLWRFHKLFPRWRWMKAAFLIWQVPKSIPPHRGRDNESFSIWSIPVVHRAHLLFCLQNISACCSFAFGFSHNFCNRGEEGFDIALLRIRVLDQPCLYKADQIQRGPKVWDQTENLGFKI